MKNLLGWTNAIRVIIVLSSYCGFVVHADSQTHSGQRSRLDVQKRSDVDQNKPADTIAKAGEGTDWREKYAELYVERREIQRELKNVKNKVAAVLASVDQQKNLPRVKALETIANYRTKQKSFIKQLERFRSYLVTILNVLEPSDSLREAVLGQYEALLADSRALLDKPSSVAERGGKDLTKKTFRVLETNRRLDAVALNGGLAEGIKPGMRWRYVDKKDGQKLILESLEVRHNLTAAIVVEGSIKRIDANDKLVLQGSGSP